MSRKKKTVIHVNQHIIKKNKKEGKLDPVLTIKTHNTNEYGYQAIIKDAKGNEVARVVYDPVKPLSCGARVWIAVESDKGSVEIVTDPPRQENPVSASSASA